MTEQQWEKINTYVAGRLVAEETFVAAVATLRRIADMTGPIYPFMIDHAKRAKPSFGFKGHHIVPESGEPTDLEFWRTDTE